MATTEALLWSAMLGVLGAILGSFIAALAVRWPAGRSVVRGRSACDSCGHVLRSIDLVPLLSALVLRGRCRDCRASIPPMHWQVELAGLAIGGAAGLVVQGPVALAGAVFGWVLLALAVLDLVAFWLPDRLTGALAVGGVITGLLGFSPGLSDRSIGGAVGFASLWLIARAYRHLRGRDGMGGGDPKLFGAIGLWLGWAMLPPVLLIASMTGLGIVLVAHIRGRPITGASALPLGTLLAIAAYPAWLFMIAIGR